MSNSLEANTSAENLSRRSEMDGVIEEIETIMMRRHFNHFQPSDEEQSEWRGKYSEKLRKIYGNLFQNSNSGTMRGFGLDSLAESMEKELYKGDT